LIVTVAAGGATDITARLTGQWLSERLSQPITIGDSQQQMIASEGFVR
jgi:tripartite-type tricarboxylate transporter receptor subunit TctC